MILRHMNGNTGKLSKNTKEKNAQRKEKMITQKDI